MRKSLLILSALLLAVAVAGAAEGEGVAPKKGAEKSKSKERKRRKRNQRMRRPRPLVESCHVLSRLGLSEEQLAKAKPLDLEILKKYEELKKQAGEDGRRIIAANKMLWELVRAARKKFLPCLTDAQKKKYDEGMKIIHGSYPKFGALKKEFNAAREKAGRDRKKHHELGTAYKAKRKALWLQVVRVLDEKIGKRPERKDEKPRPHGEKKPEEKKPTGKPEKRDPGADDFDF